MGVPKQKWTPQEEAALKAGIAKHGVGKWRTILRDTEFSSILHLRSNVDLKDKWRNMNTAPTTSGARDKARISIKRLRHPSRYDDDMLYQSPREADIEDEIVDAKPLTMFEEPLAIVNPKKSLSRLDNIIMEAIMNLGEPTGSNKTAIANYIEDQYWPPSDFMELLSEKLSTLTASKKLIKVKHKYRIAPSSSYLEDGSSKLLLLEGPQRESSSSDRTGLRSLTKSQVDAELAWMRTLSAHEAAAAAARAVAEAEAIMAEAEAASREAEAAEADAEAARAFAETAALMLKNKNASKMVGRA